jgi:hypothetical protein
MPTITSPFAPADLITRLASRVARAEAADRVFVTVPVDALRALLPLAARSLPLTTPVIPALTAALGPAQAERCYRELATKAMATADCSVLSALATARTIPESQRYGYLMARLVGHAAPGASRRVPGLA